MNNLHKSVDTATSRIRWLILNRSRRARSRRFQPLTESMEGRTVLSHVSVTAAIMAPAAIGNAGSHQSPAPGLSGGMHAMDTVVVNGQVELQPGE